MVSQERTFKLNNGTNMPVIGLGTWQSSKDEGDRAIRAALDAGYRHIDTAYNYKNEEVIGEVLHEYIKSGKVKREDLFITTKLPMIHMDPKLVKRSIEMSLKKLQLSYIDLYLVHTPIPLAYDGDDENVFPLTENGMWKAADKFDLLGTWKVECHIYLQQKELYDACKKHGIILTAYAPIGSPGRRALYKGKSEPVALEDPLVQKLATKYSKTPAQILLRFLIQRGIFVIPKSVTPERIRSNIQVFDFSLSKEDMEEFSKIKENRRYFDISYMFKDHPECPF